MIGRFAILVVGGSLACTAAADHEALGDERFGAGRYSDALAEYQLALQVEASSGELLLKAAAAALKAGTLGEAVALFGSLATVGSEWEDQAADGLWRVITTASSRDAALPAAVRALRTVSSDYPVGPHIKPLALEELAAGNWQAGDLLLEAAASVEGQSADSLLFVYGQWAARVGRCQDAVEVFEGLVRRRRAPEVEESARTGAARCALFEGRQAFNEGDWERAEGYLRRATSPAAPRDVAREAWLWIGESAIARADTQTAFEAFTRAVAGRAATADSIAGAASAKIAELLDLGGVIQ